MKKLALLFALALAFTINVEAQEKDKSKARQVEMTPEKLAQHKTDRLEKELDLTEKQKKQVYDLQLKQAKEQIAEMKEKRAKREKERAQLEAILNDTQKEKLQESFKNRDRFADKKFHGKGQRKDRTLHERSKRVKPAIDKEIDA